MRKAMDYLPRRAADLVLEALTDTRVVVVNGARQVGKSTLAEMVLRQTEGGIVRFLDDPGTRAAAVEDSVRFVRHDRTGTATSTRWTPCSRTTQARLSVSR